MNQVNHLQRVVVRAPAKVNWFLELLRKRDDGFHQIETVMSTVSLFDTLVFCRRDDNKIRLRVENGGIAAADVRAIPTGESNLVCRAIEAVRQASENGPNRQPAPAGVDVTLCKRIPSAAGLGGASSDAAATLIAMNSLWQTGLSLEQLSGLAAELGSDVPFFLTGGTAICEGRGEIITPIPCPTNWWTLIAKPTTGLSTGEVFGKLTIAKNKKQSNAADLANDMQRGRVRGIGQRLHNRLQPVAAQMNEQISELENEFEGMRCRQQCLGHQMSGSGSSYFGLFGSQRMARQAAKRLRGRLPQLQLYCCRTIATQTTQRTMLVA